MKYVVPRQQSMWWHDGRRKQFWVYIMSNPSMTLYTGVTNDLDRRVFEHKSGSGSEFTSRYHFDRLVYFETFDLITDAIEREKQIEGMTRAKKIALVKKINCEWRDLAEAPSSCAGEAAERRSAAKELRMARA